MEQLTEQEINNLLYDPVYKLLASKKITLNDATPNLTDEQRKILETPAEYRKIENLLVKYRGVCTLNELLELNTEQRELLIKKSKFDPDTLQELSRSRFITLKVLVELLTSHKTQLEELYLKVLLKLLNRDFITLEKAQQITEEEKQFLNEEQDFTNLILLGDLPLEQALKLTKEQRENVVFAQDFILNNRMLLAQALQLTAEEKLNFTYNIKNLLLEGYITFEQAKNSTQEERENLSSHFISKLFFNKIITFEKVKTITSYRDAPWTLVNLIKMEVFTLDQALAAYSNQTRADEVHWHRLNIVYIKLVSPELIERARYVQSDDDGKNSLIVYGLHKALLENYTDKLGLNYLISGITNITALRISMVLFLTPNMALHEFKNLLSDVNHIRTFAAWQQIANLGEGEILELHRQHCKTLITDQGGRAVFFSNQTAHDPVTSSGIQDAIDKLSKHYPPAVASSILEKTLSALHLHDTSHSDFEKIIMFLRNKAIMLVKLNKLTKIELLVIEACINGLKNLHHEERTLSFKFVNLVKLVICALEDERIVCNILLHSQTSADPINAVQIINDMNDRWAGWFKSSLYDSQLTYQLDRGDTSVPTDQYGLTKHKSCPGGLLNRLISALNLIHPDVVIQDGQGNIANMEKYLEMRINKYAQDNFVKIADEYLAIWIAFLTEKDIRNIQNNNEPAVKALQGNLGVRIFKHFEGRFPHANNTFLSKILLPFIDSYITDNLDVNKHLVQSRPKRLRRWSTCT